ncbi:hypothetical protein RF11_08250 [Thelohanellus kitauei]|uniref:Serpin domain-containing protein n=1 Tax=Thelohanellus kitauei TaxID=669202 RepID=A0A0C2J760_THEKT|nr:hypothetical protein RF11_08250 [Thelohanellus kitauei]
MADTINQLSLKLANYYFDNHEEMTTISVSGYVTYFTLLLINFGLQGQAKYDLSAFLDCNYSYIEFSFEKNVFEYECINLLRMDELSHIGSARSAIFHSRYLFETFQLMAIQSFDFQPKPIDPVNSQHQYFSIYEWSNIFKKLPHGYIFSESQLSELILFIVNEIEIKFQWFAPANKRYTRTKTFTDIYSRQYEIKMMRLIDYLSFYNDLQLKASIYFVRLKQTGILAFNLGFLRTV